MKTYFVNNTNNDANVRDALGRLIEYAYFLEEETGRSHDSFVKQILEEDDISITEEDV